MNSLPFYSGSQVVFGARHAQPVPWAPRLTVRHFAFFEKVALLEGRVENPQILMITIAMFNGCLMVI